MMAISEAESVGTARRMISKRMTRAPFTHPSCRQVWTHHTSCVRRECYDLPRAMSTITKHRRDALGRFGSEIRRHRHSRGMTQTELGWPLTRAFVSAVEHGRCLPSLAAVALFAERLGISPAELLDPVKHELAALYTAPDAPSRDARTGP